MSISKTKVVIVEDNAFQRMCFEEMISRDAGFLLAGSYANEKKAMEEIAKIQPDVALLDIHLDGLCVLDLIPQMKQLSPQVQIMVCTSEDHDEMIYKAFVFGADAYVLKSSGQDVILSSLSQLRNGEVCLPGVVARKLIERLRKDVWVDGYEKENLSRRQEEILGLLLKGKFYKEIAMELSISVETVRKHVHHIYKKLKVGNRLEAYNRVINKI